MYALALISVSAGVTGLLCPEGEREGLRRWMNFVTGLAVCCVLLSPLKALLSGIPSWISGLVQGTEQGGEETEWDAVSLFIDSAAERIIREAEEGICAAHGLRKEQVELRAELDASDSSAVRVRHAEVTLRNVGDEIAGMIREELENMLMCTVTVTMTEGEVYECEK